MQSQLAENQTWQNKGYALDAINFLRACNYDDALDLYDLIEKDPFCDDDVLAAVGLCDRFYFLTRVLNVGMIFRSYKPAWIYERCREVEANPDGCLDLWAREHWKSTIITIAGSLQECAKDSTLYQTLDQPDSYYRGPGQEITIGIFSHNTAIARDFVRRIKLEMEQNARLKRLYSDVFWNEPEKEAPAWALDHGLILKRQSNPTEATISGWGLVDGLPTSKHFRLMIYDDTVTEKSVTTPEMIIKTTLAWELSSFLSAQVDPEREPRKWHIGTRYNYADTYQTMLDRKAVKARVYPATKDGTMDGEPVLLSPDQWAKKKRDNSPATVACQLLQNPIAGEQQEFKPEWMRKYEVRPEIINVAILVDPANSKKKGSSNTAMAVLGIDQAWNKYLLDGACHKMNLGERWNYLKGFHKKWIKAKGVQVVVIGYEKYGMQADIEHYEQMMQIEKYAFPIQEVSWTRNTTEQAKDDRIRRLIPDHQNWKFFYPYEGEPTRTQMEYEERGKGFLVAKPIKRKDHEGQFYNLVEYLVRNEYLFFPATTRKDFMDAMSRVYDIEMRPPQIVKEEDTLPPYLGEA